MSGIAWQCSLASIDRKQRMNAFVLSLLFAARGGGGDGAGAAGALIVLVGTIIVAVLLYNAEANKTKNAVWREAESGTGSGKREESGTGPLGRKAGQVRYYLLKPRPLAV